MPNELSEKVYPDGTVVKLRDDAAREQISDLQASKAYYANLGNISGSTVENVLSNAWDALNVYDNPVIVRFVNSGTYMGMMYKYTGSLYGMAIAMKHGGTTIYKMGVNNGSKTYATT